MSCLGLDLHLYADEHVINVFQLYIYIFCHDFLKRF